MWISIRVQLGVLVLLAALIGLAVLVIATWTTNYTFVSDVSSANLALTASLKAGQVASSLSLMQALVRNFSTRTRIQLALQRYYRNNGPQDWSAARDDVLVILDADPTAAFLIQAVVLGYNSSRRFIAETASSVIGKIQLPYTYSNGSKVHLGDRDPDQPYIGFPPSLYPNLTVDCVSLNESSSCQSTAVLDGFTIRGRRTLVLGPYHVNETFSLISMTQAIGSTNKTNEVLGWMTVVLNAQLIGSTINSREGLHQTGSTLVVGSTNITNRFSPPVVEELNKTKPNRSFLEQQPFHFLFSPDPSDLSSGPTFAPLLTNTNPVPDGTGSSASGISTAQQDNLRETRKSGGPNSVGFKLGQFPALLDGLVDAEKTVNGAGSSIDTVNERGEAVSVGYAIPPTRMVDWVVVVEVAKSEVWAPIRQLRKIVLACVFSTVGFLLILCFPIGHYSTAAIRRLRDATKASVGKDNGDGGEDGSIVRGDNSSKGSIDKAGDHERKTFRIPSKVKDRRHFIHDELTDLTGTFNAMTDELLAQYSRLEERVRVRTAELEASKRAAEKANESKTVFIANVSHELKTPLNGIMGMCSVLKDELSAYPEWKKSLDVIYYCGDLLLKLVTDLLTVSKLQAGHMSLDQRAFRLHHVGEVIRLNLTALADEKGNHLNVMFEDYTGVGSDEIGTRIDELWLWGDEDRLMQIATNLISNAIKFTPPGGYIRTVFRAVGMKASRTIELGPDSNSVTAVETDEKASVAGTRGKRKSVTSVHSLPHSHSNDATSNPVRGNKVLKIELEVTDDGPGVSPSIQSSIFEPFFQGELGLDKKYGGTGLGLSICQNLARLMGGSIFLRDGSGKGATFVVQLPFPIVDDPEGAEGGENRAPNVTELPPSGHGEQEKNEALVSSTRSSPVIDSGVADPMGDTRRFSCSPRPTDCQPSTTITCPPTDRLSATEAVVRSPSSTSASASTSATPMPTPISASTAGSAAPTARTISPSPSSATMAVPFRGSSPISVLSPSSFNAPTSSHRPRILIADDNQINVQIVRRMLALMNILNIDEAFNGQQAFERVAESLKSGNTPYDLILMDVQMPVLSGTDATRRIRSELGYAGQVVALTAYSEQQNMDDCRQAGMDDFISKPIKRPRLETIMRNCLNEMYAEEGEARDAHKGGGGDGSVREHANESGGGTVVGTRNADELANWPKHPLMPSRSVSSEAAIPSVSQPATPSEPKHAPDIRPDTLRTSCLSAAAAAQYPAQSLHTLVSEGAGAAVFKTSSEADASSGVDVISISTTLAEGQRDGGERDPGRAHETHTPRPSIGGRSFTDPPPERGPGGVPVSELDNW